MRYDLYEWLVTSFELINASSIFQCYVKWVLQDLLNDFCFTYVNDILIYMNDSLMKNQDHVWKVLVQLCDTGLQLDIDKCEFEVKETRYLEFVIFTDKDIKMNSAKIKVIEQWKASKTVTVIWSFLEFVNFYQIFIHNYSDLTMLLTRLTHKNSVFFWNHSCQVAFDKLKHMFMSAFILVQFNYN